MTTTMKTPFRVAVVLDGVEREMDVTAESAVHAVIETAQHLPRASTVRLVAEPVATQGGDMHIADRSGRRHGVDANGDQDSITGMLDEVQAHRFAPGVIDGPHRRGWRAGWARFAGWMNEVCR